MSRFDEEDDEEYGGGSTTVVSARSNSKPVVPTKKPNKKNRRLAMKMTSFDDDEGDDHEEGGGGVVKADDGIDQIITDLLKSDMMRDLHLWADEASESRQLSSFVKLARSVTLNTDFESIAMIHSKFSSARENDSEAKNLYTLMLTGFKVFLPLVNNIVSLPVLRHLGGVATQLQMNERALISAIRAVVEEGGSVLPQGPQINLAILLGTILFTSYGASVAEEKARLMALREEKKRQQQQVTESSQTQQQQEQPPPASRCPMFNFSMPNSSSSASFSSISLPPPPPSLSSSLQPPPASAVMSEQQASSWLDNLPTPHELAKRGQTQDAVFTPILARPILGSGANNNMPVEAPPHPGMEALRKRQQQHEQQQQQQQQQPPPPAMTVVPSPPPPPQPIDGDIEVM